MVEKGQTKKEITMDDLALMVANGFNEMDEKFDRIDENFKEIKRGLGGEIRNSEENIKAEINKKVDKIEYNTLEYRVEKLEKKLA